MRASAANAARRSPAAAPAAAPSCARRAKFCDECGTPVGARPRAAAGRAAATATRKTVTALFADLVGSTSFGERTDAEVARTVMARYHALLQDAIDAHGGTVAKFMGDGMMATFGIPEIAEDDAVRAVRAGVEIQRRFTDFAAEVATQHGETLGLRVGVNTGEVVIASGDADLVGDALNVAARIEQACRPGPRARRRGDVAAHPRRVRLRDARRGDGRGPGPAGRDLRGRAGHRDRRGRDRGTVRRPDAGDGPPPRGVRRRDRRARAARLVTVLGSPGVGKTRLSRELCAATEADDGADHVRDPLRPRRRRDVRADRAADPRRDRTSATTPTPRRRANGSARCSPTTRPTATVWSTSSAGSSARRRRAASRRRSGRSAGS